MLLVTEALPKQLAEQLLQHNIRFVEQFLSLIRERRTARAFGEAMGCSLEDLEVIARKVEAEHPDLVVPEPRGKEYSLGYGKKSDWEPYETS
jgi:hypothetical protein